MIIPIEDEKEKKTKSGWNTDNTIAKLIVPRLKAFREYNHKHGVPTGINGIAEWNKMIDKMIYAFELNIYAPGPFPSKKRMLFKKGLICFTSSIKIYGIKNDEIKNIEWFDYCLE